MTFVEFPEGELPPKEIAIKTGLSSRQVRNLCEKGIIKAKRYYVPGLQALWSIYENLLPDFIASNIPREIINIQIIEKRIKKQMAEYRKITGKNLEDTIGLEVKFMTVKSTRG